MLLQQLELDGILFCRIISETTRTGKNRWWDSSYIACREVLHKNFVRLPTVKNSSAR
jgi:hypothetical protein